MSDDQAETWRVIDDAGEVRIVEVTHVTNQSFPYWEAWCHAERHGGMLSQNSARHAVLELAANHKWNAVEILAPGEPTRAEVVADQRDTERDCKLRIEAAGEILQRFFDNERAILHKCGELREQVATAWADGARAMRDAAVAAVKRRAEALDASVTDDEAEDDEEGYGRFQEALELVDTLGALTIPEAPKAEAK